MDAAGSSLLKLSAGTSGRNVQFFVGSSIEAILHLAHRLIAIVGNPHIGTIEDCAARIYAGPEAAFLFQVISERAERAAIIVTTNLPFSEWTTVFPNPRLCAPHLESIARTTGYEPATSP